MPDYEAAARRAAKRHGIDPDVFVAQLKQESGLKPGLTSSAGAQGIAQFIPSTAAAYGVNLHDGRVTDDLNGAARYMADNLKKTGGNYQQALSIYNSGRPDAYKDPNFAGGQTYNYVRTIMGAAKVKAPKSTPAPASPPATPAPVTAQTPAVPGVDNSGLRRQLVGSFLQQGGVKNSSAVLGLAAQYGQAADVQPVVSTTRAKQPSTSTRASTSRGSKLSGSKVLELIYNDGGKGYGIKNGQTVNGSQVFGAVWEGHKTHVHAAAGPNTIVALGKLAQSMGLRVGENEYFTGQRPAAGVHTDTSNHYREGRTKSGKPAEYAIDVSGDAAKMKQFARAVAQYNRTRTLPK